MELEQEGPNLGEQPVDIGLDSTDESNAASEASVQVAHEQVVERTADGFGWKRIGAPDYLNLDQSIGERIHHFEAPHGGIISCIISPEETVIQANLLRRGASDVLASFVHMLRQQGLSVRVLDVGLDHEDKNDRDRH